MVNSSYRKALPTYVQTILTSSTINMNFVARSAIYEESQVTTPILRSAAYHSFVAAWVVHLPSKLTSIARLMTEKGTHSSSPRAHQDSQLTMAQSPCAPSGRWSTM